MSSQSSWRPNLSESQLSDEKFFLQGAILSAVAYGINLGVFTLVISLLSTRLNADIKQNGRASRQTICLLTYACVMFILSTLSVASQAEIIQLSFIENRDILGGPMAYQKRMSSIPIRNLGNYCGCIMNWFSDGLVFWHCSVIYRSSRISPWLVMALPGLMLIASFVTGTIVLERTSSSPWTSTDFALSLTYMTTTISLNVILTLMIGIRLYLHRRHLTKVMGGHHAAHYTHFISILIQSAAVPLVVAFWLLILFAMGNQLATIPLSFIIQAQATAVCMIIFRVVKGTAWTTDSTSTIPDIPEQVGTLSNIRFQSASVAHAESLVASRSRNQFLRDGSHNTPGSESNNCDTVYESSPRHPAF